MRKIVFQALLAYCAWSQPRFDYRVDTVAGSIPNQEGIPASEALFYGPAGIALGADRAIHVSDPRYGVRTIAADGSISAFKPAMSGGFPIAADQTGFLYSVIGNQLSIRTPNGEARTITPLGPPFALGGSILVAVAAGQDGTAIIADSRNQIIARVNRDGSVQPIVGRGSGITLNIVPRDVAIAKNGDIYISTDNRISRLSTDGTLSPFAGNGEYGRPILGLPTLQSPFSMIRSIACGNLGELYVYEATTQSVLAINSGGVIERAVWEGAVADLAVEASGALLVLDFVGQVHRIQDGVKTVVAGRLPFAGDGGPATEAILNSPGAALPDPNGGFFIADTRNHRIRRVSLDGTITTIAGTGEPGSGAPGSDGTGGGPAADAHIPGPTRLALDTQGNLYFASSQKVRRLRPDGIVENVAGTGAFGDTGDGGPATEATFQNIGSFAVDKLGAVYISDWRSNRVRVVKNGQISTYAGTGVSGFGENDVPATSTPLSEPTLLAFDDSGDLVILESFVPNIGPRVRKVNSATGAITTLVRTSPLGTPGEAASGLCFFSSVSGIAFDPEGNLFVAGGNRVCRYDKDGRSWVISGSTRGGFAGDGASALEAQFAFTLGLALDSSGAIFLADTGNQRIRKLTPVPTWPRN